MKEEQNLAIFFGTISIVIAIAGIWQIGESIIWIIKLI